MLTFKKLKLKIFFLDIDECLTSNGGCGDPITASCTNTYASFYCQCTTGYNGTPPLCTGTFKFVWKFVKKDNKILNIVLLAV